MMENPPFYSRRIKGIIEEENDDDERTISIPTFHESDIVLGNYLQNGGLSEVVEIQAFTIPTPLSVENGDRSPSKYVMKRLRKQVIEDPKKKYLGIITLNEESKLLSTLQHRNIIQLRGKLCTKHDDKDKDKDGPSRNNQRLSLVSNVEGLILDRLYDTLQSRLPKWLEEKKKLNKVYNRVFALTSKKTQKKRNERKFNLLYERLEAACELSSAIKYLHDRRIIHRDIKPGNIGFDARGTIKLFDFGSAQELPRLQSDSCSSRSLGSNSNNTIMQQQKRKRKFYNLSMKTGSLRYMAPEVALGRQYNELCDVYSFSLVLWEIFTLCEHQKRVYEDIHSEQSFYDWVFIGGRRPPLVFFDNELSLSLASLLAGGWDHNPEKRYTSTDMYNILWNEKENLKLKRDYHRQTSNTSYYGTGYNTIRHNNHAGVGSGALSKDSLESSLNSFSCSLARIGSN